MSIIIMMSPLQQSRLLSPRFSPPRRTGRTNLLATLPPLPLPCHINHRYRLSPSLFMLQEASRVLLSTRAAAAVVRRSNGTDPQVLLNPRLELMDKAVLVQC